MTAAPRRLLFAAAAPMLFFVGFQLTPGSAEQLASADTLGKARVIVRRRYERCAARSCVDDANAAPEARSRATTIFTSHMWGGNAVGAMLASYAYAHWGWYAVCAIGAVAASIALAVAQITNRK